MLIPRQALELHNAASKDDPRYQINGSFIDRGRAVATDGHLLVVAEWEHGESEKDYPATKDGLLNEYSPDWKPRILPADTCKAALKAMPRKGGSPVLENLAVNEVKSAANGEIHCGVTDLETITRFAPQSDPEATFPQWRKVIPSHDQATVTVCLGIGVLEKMLNTLKKTGCSRVTFGIKDGDSVLRIDGKGSDGLTVYGAMMPRRDA